MPLLASDMCYRTRRDMIEGGGARVECHDRVELVASSERDGAAESDMYKEVLRSDERGFACPGDPADAFLYNDAPPNFTTFWLMLTH